MSLFDEAVENHRRKVAEYNNQRRPSKVSQNRLRWLRPTEQAVDLTIRSPLEWWYSHWDVAERRSRRCGGQGCIPCTLGQPVIIRFVLAVEDHAGVVWLMELNERALPFLDSLREAPKGQVGAVVRVLKTWKAKNAPIQLELVDRREVSPIEVSRVVSTLGLPAQRSLKVEK